MKLKKIHIADVKDPVKGRGLKADRVSIEEYNQELQEAETEFGKGEYTTHDEFVKQIKKW